MSNLGTCQVKNEALLRWVKEMAELCTPDQIFWCDGSEAERAALTAQAVEEGVLVKLNQEKLPGCY